MAEYIVDKNFHSDLNISQLQPSLRAVIAFVPKRSSAKFEVISFEVTHVDPPPVIPHKIYIVDGFLSSNWNWAEVKGYPGNPIPNRFRDSIGIQAGFVSAIPVQLAPDGKWWQVGVIQHSVGDFMVLNYEDSPGDFHASRRIDIRLVVSGVASVSSVDM